MSLTSESSLLSDILEYLVLIPSRNAAILLLIVIDETPSSLAM